MTPGLALGTAQLTRAYGVAARHGDDASGARSEALLRAAEALGVEGLDTAPGYGLAHPSRRRGDGGVNESATCPPLQPLAAPP